MAVTYSLPRGNVYLSGNPIQVIITGDTERTNLRLAVKVNCTQLLDPAQIEEYEPVDLVVDQDISGLMREPLDSEFNYPAGGKVSAHSALALVVHLYFGEVWDDDDGERQESWNSEYATLRVLDGKLRDYEYALLNDDDNTFYDEFILGGRFLTNLLNNMVVAPDQLIKLWLLSPWDENHDVVFNWKPETDDKVGHLPYQEDVTLFASGLFEFTMNPDFIGFYPSGGAHVIAYTFWLTDKATGEDVTERRRFVVDNTYYENKYFAYCRNEYSAIESVWLRGEIKEGLNVENENASRPINADSGSKTASLITTSSSGQRYWQINTGNPSREQLLALRDFLEARERWIVNPDDATKLIPVYIEGGDFNLYDSLEDLNNVNVKLIEAHKR